MRDYTVIINKKEYKVSFKVFVAHCTGEFNSIQPMSVYNKFLSQYKLPIDNFLLFISNYLDTEYMNKIKYIYSSICANACKYIYISDLKCPLFFAIYIDYLLLLNKNGRVSIKSLFNIIEYYINFNKNILGEEYNKLQPLTAFYHELIYEINTEINSNKSKFIIPREIIKIEDIKAAINIINPSVNFEDIRKDLDTHAVIVDMEDYFLWGSNTIKKWYWDLSYNDISLLNFNKLIHMHIYK